MSNIAAKAISALFAITLGFLATSTMANTDNDAIAERIKPVGSVCVEGEDCGGPATAAAGGAFSAADTYTASCAACHASGILDAPKFGSSDWSDRATAKGMDTLVTNAINGINAMPPRGTCASCSDDDIKALVEYMVDSAK
ncbi:c-type cytochrome [Amphritea balenae]|uniref:Cytochrome c5 family protein n=1 Tax=Amphritea balenae TaxID=452629 RepID=A0A3P1SPE1_9GAMM|nr:c-type cytochrome [Amphritea balenae]RRC98987.1 cytochrome c5 family protein [Amphritea balenae]